MKINASLVNPFVEAAGAVVKQITGTEARRGNITYSARPEARYGVSVVIGVEGRFTGQLVYNMKTDAAERLVEMMHPDKPAHSRKKLFSDAIGGFAHLITERAFGILGRGGNPPTEVSGPSVFTGERLEVALASRPTLVIGLHTSFGQLEINVALCDGGEAGGNGGKRRQGGGR